MVNWKMTSMITPITGQRNRKIICCTFADEVEEYGEVLPHLELGHDPKTDKWFLTSNHDMDVEFPCRPFEDSYDKLFAAEEKYGEDSDICKAMEEELELGTETEFEDVFKDVDVLKDTEVANPQYFIHIYELAKIAGYDLDKSAPLVYWLFVRAARLLETGKV